MRKNILHVTENIRESLKNWLDDNRELADVIVKAEMMLYVFQKIAPGKLATEAWSLIPGYNEPIVSDTHQDMVDRLRILLPSFRNKRGWHDLLGQYKSIQLTYRCFVIYEDNSFSWKEPSVVKERMETYERIITHPIAHKELDKKMASFGKVSYKRKVGDSFERYSFVIPSHLIAEETIQFPHYREKRKFEIPVNFDWHSIAQEMDEQEGASTNKWEERIQVFDFQSLDRFFNTFHFKGNQHIVGGLGAGKSTWRTIMTYYLVKKCNAKIGFIEGSVQDVLAKVKELKGLGIKAVPIIGTSTRQRHLNTYLFSRKEKIYGVSDWADVEHENLNYLAGICTARMLANDFARDDFSYVPCKKIIHDKKTTLCPMYKTCGVHRAATELLDADVWVGTSLGVIKSRIPTAVDPYERTYYEAMYDLLDIIMVDEGDKVQQEFDQAFITEHELIGNEGSLFEKLVSSVNRKIRGNYDLLSNTLVSNWQLHLDQIKNAIDKIYPVLTYSKSLRKSLKNDIFHVYRLLHDLSEKMFGDEYEKNNGFKYLSEYVKKPLDNPDFVPLVDDLLKRNEPKKDLEKIENKLIELDIYPKGSIKKEKFLQEFGFFLYLVKVDFLLRYLIENYPIVSNYLGIENEIDQIFRSTPRDLKPFILDGMTGMMLGYRYQEKEGDKVGIFKLVEYSGVGRHLLQNWHCLYEKAEGRKGPAVVFLSGTSHAPGSHHYHLETPVRWLLVSKKETPRIEQFFTPLFDDQENGAPLYVSGIPDKERRHAQLQKIAHQLKGNIEAELDYWKSTQHVNRKVLLVVNSYEDCKAVGSSFERNLEWKNRYKVLVSGISETKEDQYPRELIEDFCKTEADVLVVPLSSIGRGYNILDSDKSGALFGSVFFLIRPYPVPGDMQNMIQILHAYLPTFLKEIQGKGLRYEAGITALRKRSIVMLQTMVRRSDYWSGLNEKDREILSWYTFVLVWQMIGRLLRGGRDARVHYVDNKFSPNRAAGEGIEDNPETSLLESWKAIMRKYQHDSVFRALYGPFMDSIQNLK